MLTRHPPRLTVLVLALMAGLAFGQGLTGFGATVGLNLANIGVGDATKDELGSDPAMKFGFALGGFATLDLGLPVLIRPEVIFSQKGYRTEVSVTEGGITIDLKGTFRLNYLDINALAVYSISDQISIFAGPSISPYLNGKGKLEVDISIEGDADPILQAIVDALEEELTGEEDIESDDMNGMDFGLIVGAWYNLGRITIEARYSLGLKKAIDEDFDAKNRVIQIMVGYGF